MQKGKIVTLRIFERIASVGRKMPAIRLSDQAGIIGDMHYGEKEMQITIMTKSTESWMQDKKGLCFQRFRCNLVLDGVEEESLQVGNFLKIGSAVLEIAGYEQRCFSECERYVKHTDCPLMKGRCYAKVLHDGKIRRGDTVEVIEAVEQAESEERKQLRESSALIIGAGGIGCSAAYALAESGMGTIGIVDSGTIKEEDLKSLRDLKPEDIGKNRAECVAGHLMEQYPQCAAEAWIDSITEENGERLIPGYQMVLLTANTAETKAAVRAVAARHQIPLVDDKKVAELIGAAEAEYAIAVLTGRA